jgi:SagB-type dehydrogenase family enzyme
MTDKSMIEKFREEFFEKTNLNNVSPAGRESGAAQPSMILMEDAKTPRISLPEPDFFEDVNVNFLELVEMRTTVRKYKSDEPLTLKNLSYLLWCTQGIKMVLPDGYTRRNVPSAGGSHPFETYLLLQNVEKLDRGLYRFLPLEHKLIKITADKDKISEIEAAFLNRPMILDSSATFIWAADMKRTEHKFAERACRYVMMDAGHVCQNMYLAAQTINYGCCAIGHFDDELLNKALGFDGDLVAVYAATVGR